MISRPEFHEMMNRRRLRSSGQAVPGEKAFDVLDVNKDGVVTVDEVVKGTDLTKDKVISTLTLTLSSNELNIPRCCLA